MMKISIIHDTSELVPYMDPWNQILLEIGNTNPFVTPDWITGWWHFYGGKYEMYILALAAGEELIGFCPLMQIRKRPFTEVRFIGTPQASRMNLIVRPGYEQVFVRQLAAHLFCAKGTVLYTLHGWERKDVCYKYLLELLADRPYTIHALPSCIVNLKSVKPEDYFRKRRNHKPVKLTFRREKQLQKLCSVRFEQAAREDLETIFRLHQKRWSKKIDGNGFGRGVSKAFFSWLAYERRSSYWNVVVYLLKAGVRTIGFAYGIECNGRYSSYRKAHDDDFAYLMPGMIMTKRILEECFARNYTVFDFLAGTEPHKKYWTDEMEWVEDIHFGTHTAAVDVLILAERIKYSIHRFLKNIPAFVRFKRVTAGKILYALTGAPERALIKRVIKTVKQRGLAGLLRRSLAYAPKALYTAYSCSPELASGEILLRAAAVDEVGSLADLTNMNADKIVKRYVKGSQCQILLKDAKPIGYAFLSDRNLMDKEKLLWKPDTSGDCCCYDICIYKKQRSQVLIRNALACLAGQPLPKGCRMDFMIQTCDHKLIRAADVILQRKKLTTGQKK